MTIEQILTNRFIEANGTQFQGMFYEIMRAKYGTDFAMPRAYGNSGDFKNDGILISEGIYYALYSPENPNYQDTNQKDAIKKFISDIDGLIDRIKDGTWAYDFNEFIFVYNAKSYASIPAPLLSEFSTKQKELNEEYPDLKLSYITQYDLKSIFMTLHTDKQKYILEKTYMALEEINLDGTVMAHLLEKMYSRNFVKSRVHKLMDFEEKIKYNNLNEERESDLLHASYNINDFLIFSRGLDPSYMEHLFNICRTSYDEAVEKYPDNENNQFDYVLENIYQYDSKDVDSSLHNIKIVKENKLIIISVFFENCSIFKSKK